MISHFIKGSGSEYLIEMRKGNPFGISGSHLKFCFLLL
uniref:Uncharacterized protein n=1 Tax=Anguilla anguilla TaxID=7936 RepID=A0A0E9R355_ANGAN